jgi:hypothetical protein
MAERAGSGRKMTLTITDCRHVYSGVNKKGDTYEIYEIDATKDGAKINEKLRAFASLAIGQPIAVNVVPFESEQYGKSFTLYEVGASKATSTAEGLNELRREVTELATRQRDLLARVDGLQQMMRPAVAAPAADGAKLDEEFGKDAPW